MSHTPAPPDVASEPVVAPEPEPQPPPDYEAAAPPPEEPEAPPPEEPEPQPSYEEEYEQQEPPYEGEAYAEDQAPYEEPPPEYETAPMAGPPDVLPPHPYDVGPMTGPPHLLEQMYATGPMGGPPHAPMQAPPPMQPDGGPYRVPPYDPTFLPARGVPIPRPILGSAIAVYGVLLWSFVLAGQFATSWFGAAPMDEGLAVFIVFASTLIAWVVAVRRSKSALPPPTRAKLVGRSLGIVALAFTAFFVTLIGATIAGQIGARDHDFVIAFGLVTIAVTASALGPRLAHPLRPALSHGARFGVVVMWLVGAIATFVAGAQLATNG
ncbi:MAG: hypothetical protein KIT84_19460 [Labilithrix sp.]|nr:hypothetical protein [Labilithrix sp.]MCW5813214.1 hypothetical protein [Labilithrix sp.]